MTEQFNRTHLFHLAEGIRLFNAQKYWECHEELELHWLEEAGAVRNIYWAIIQVAAALIHYRNNHLAGADGLIKKALQKFSKCEELKVESDILEEYLSWSVLKKIVRNIPLNPKLNDYNELFNFKFKDPESWK